MMIESVKWLDGAMTQWLDGQMARWLEYPIVWGQTMVQKGERYGLIAGNGRFPFMVLESARLQSLDVVVAAIKEETFPEIESCGYPVHWLGLGQLARLVRLFKETGVRKAIMAGQVKHAQIFSSSIP